MIFRIGDRNIAHRLMFDCVIAVLPLLALNIYQTVASSNASGALKHEFAAYAATYDAREAYRLFMVGVNDAVDTGSLAKPALESLATSARSLDAAASAGVRDAVEISRNVASIRAALANKTTLEALGPVKNLVTASSQAVEKLGEGGRSHLQAFTSDEQQAAQRRSQIVVGMTFATLVMLIVMVRRAIGRVVRPLSMAVATTEGVARGQLLQTVPTTSKDETGQLINGQHEMVQSLRKVVTEVRSGSDAVALASGDIATGASSLSERTAMQAGKLHDASQALASMTDGVQANADTSQSAADLATCATSAAEAGRAAMQALVEIMGQIQASSQRIGEITGVIDTIAFQTNILALNAAVEAARAGDHGKGFAVVASEVRSLARRASAASREIKTLINESAGRVRIGGATVNHAGETITDVEAQVRSVRDLIGRIAEVTRSQSSGLRDVDVAIREVSTITQQNAVMARDSSAAALDLQGHARDLTSVVAGFELQGTPN